MAATQQIAVELVAKMDGLARDFGQATNIAETSAQKMQTAFSGVKTAIVGVGAALLGSFSVDYFAGIVKSSIAAAGGLKDLSEQTGASVKALSALKGIGKLSETGIDSITGAMNKFAKGLAGVDEESKGVPMALNAIGLNFNKLKSMKPEDAMLAVANAMEGFEDGAGKASVAMALYGKEGAKMIPFLKDMATVGELNGRVTEEQAAMADEYEKNLVRLKAASESWKRDLAMGLLPTLSDLAGFMRQLTTETSGVRDEIHKLSADGSIGTWADKAVEGLAFVGNAAHGVVIAFQAVGRVIASQFAVINSMTSGLSADKFALMAANPAAGVATISKQLAENLKGAKSVFSASGEDLNNVLSQELVGDKFLRRFKSFRESQIQTYEGVFTGGMTLPEQKKKIAGNWGYKPSAGAAKSETSDYEKLIRTLNEKIAVQQEELGVTEKLTDAQKEYAKFQTQIKEGYIKLSPDELKGAEELWRRFLDQAAQLKQKAQDQTYESARQQIQTLNESFARDNQSKLASMTIMAESERSLIEALNAVEEKGKADKDKFNAQHRKKEIDDKKLAQLTDELTESIERQKEAVRQLHEQNLQNSASFEYGARKGLQAYLDDVANVAKSTEALMTKSFQGMEDALVNFVQTGKLDFKSLVDSILADMARITIRENITGPLARWMNGGSSGGMGWLGSLFGGGGGGNPATWSETSFMSPWANANGGVYASPSLSAYSGQIVNRPTMFAFASGAGVMGEAGPEAILPLKRGSNGKLGVHAGGGNPVNITVHVNGSQNAPDVRRSAAQGAREALAAFNMAGRYA